MLSPVDELTLTHHHVPLQRAGRSALQLRCLDRGGPFRHTQLLVIFLIISWWVVNSLLWSDRRVFVRFLLRGSFFVELIIDFTTSLLKSYHIFLVFNSNQGLLEAFPVEV